MLKAVALSIALIVGMGPAGGLLCRSWCNQHLAAAAGCHDPGPADELRVTATHACDDVVLATSTFVLDDARRGVGPPAGHALAGTEYGFIIRSFDLLPPHGAVSGHPVQGPPLSINLRI